MDEWKSGRVLKSDGSEFLAKDAFVDEDLTISPELIRELQLEEKELKRSFPFTISTESRDRHGDRVTVKGWVLKEIERNPVVPWSHNYNMPPLGSIKRIWKTHAGENGRKLKAIKQFAPKGMYPFADMIHDMVQARLIRMASVGFIPLEYEKDTEASEEDKKRFYMPMLHKKQELIESSIVMIGSNRDALQEARALNIDVSPMEKWAEVVLDTKSFEPELGISQEEVEAAWKVTHSEKKFFYDFEPESKEYPVEKYLEALKSFEATLGETISKALDTRLASFQETLLKAVDERIAKALKPEENKPAEPEITPEKVKAAVKAALGIKE
jgi:hypothetical protein